MLKPWLAIKEGGLLLNVVISDCVLTPQRLLWSQHTGLFNLTLQ
jgi:hypothetical protein